VADQVTEREGEALLDGRIARGQRRRAEIIESTLQVIEEHGVAGVTHRAVAKSIGVSPSAIAHHFPTIDDLLTAALTSGNVWSDDQFDEATTVDELAHIVWAQLREESRRLTAIYELYLLASRREALRPAARGWVEAVRKTARRLGADPAGETSLVTAIDGLGLLALLADDEIEESAVRDVLRRALA
jgi:DNA-binding transcriptional regulator YbjK